MSNTVDFSVEDEHYLAAVLGEPKMTMDEVGADIDEHGHIPVTPETATQDPFSTKGSLANALDELEGEIEGTTDTPQSGLIEPDADGIPPNEPMIQQDSAVSVKDSLSDALDAIVMDANPSDYTEEKDPMPRAKAPNLPTSLGGDEDKPDENGLVYITRTFTVDPNRYISNNYRPNPAQANINPIKPLAKATVNPQEEAELSDLGTPEARESAQESDEPTATEEAAAAQEANNEEQKEEEVVEVKETEDVIPAESKGKKSAKSAQDEAIEPQEKVALDYATFIDGSSFLCFDEISDIDYTKIAMDAGPRKKVTRENCQTTFAQCRAQNPLFCRFHGPKLLEADIKTQIRAYLGAGCVVSVTKDKSSKNKFTFRLTVGCPPHLKDKVEQLIDMYMTQQPGISSAENGMTDISGDDKKNVLTQEFDMDILKADEPPKPASLGQKALYRTQEAERKGKVMPVVGDTPSQIEKKAKGGIAPQAAEESPAEPTEPQPEATPQETEPNVEEPQEQQPIEQPKQSEPTEETPPPPEPKENPPEEPPVEEPKAPSTEEGTSPQNGETETTIPPQISTKPKKKVVNPYTFDAYGEPPNDDPRTNDVELGGTGDYIGAELMKFASIWGLLKMPKNWGAYAKDLANWKRAKRTGGLYHGQAPTSLNRPKARGDYGITDPMTDWIENFMDGDPRKNRKGDFEAIFGKKPEEGSNDQIPDRLPPELQHFAEQEGMEALADALLEAREKFRKWVSDCRAAKEKARADKAAGKSRQTDEDLDAADENFVSIDEIEAKENADAEYADALGEILKYNVDSPEIQYFNQDNLGKLNPGDSIRFDHSDSTFEVVDYNPEDNSLTVVPSGVMDNPILEDWEKDGAKERYRITDSGFERIPNEPKGTEHDGENEDGTTETGSSDANGAAEPSERKSTAGTNGKSKGGVTPPEQAADIALKGTPSPEIRKAAETIKDASDTAKNESRKAEELDKKGATLKGNGEGGVIAKSAVDLAAAEAAKKAEEAKSKAAKEAEALAKKQEEAFRAAEKKSKGEAAATIEKTLTDMALSIFRQDSKSDSIEDEADSILNWMGDLAKKKGIDYTPSEEMSDAVAEIKKDAQQLEWLMGNLQKAMDATGGDFHSEDLDHIVGSLQRKASKISGAFSELNRMGMAEIARINQAADLANQKAKLMPKGSGETKGGATTSSRPTEQQFNEAAMLLANENIDTLDDAFAGLSALVDGKVQGFGAMSAEEIASEMADRYIKTLEKGGDKYKPMVDAIKSAIGKQKEAPKNDAAVSPKQSSASSPKKGDSRSRIEQVYKDWVEEEVPDWAKNLSDEEAAKYADLLEKAANWDSEKDGENTALHDLDAYEEGYRQKEAAAKEAEVKAKEEVKKAAEQKQADARKDILAATKRLGMDAYKPEAELRKLLAQARGHASGNPRMEQKVKDLEAVLADRESKKNLAPREGGKYVGDEMPKEEARNLVAEMIIKALEI